MALSDEARRIVEAARDAYRPSEEDRARVAAVLPLQPTATAAASGAAAGALAGKGAILGLAALVVLGGATVGYWWSHARAVAPAPAATPLPSARTARPIQAREPEAPKSIPSVPDEIVTPPARAVRSRPAQRTAAVKTAAPEPSPNVAGELALLDEAQRALAGGHPDRALQLLAQHARDFPHGSFVEERTAARIIALCALGRVTTARAESAAFVKQFPTSPLGDRVRAACGTDVAPVGRQK